MTKILGCLTHIVSLWGCAASLTYALDQGEARHLLARTGFAGTPAEIDALLPMTREQAVDELIASTRTVSRTSPPDFCTQSDLPSYMREWKDEFATADANPDKVQREKIRSELYNKRYRHGRDLKAWWMQEMVTTDSPLTERMVLFWSNHFTSALRTVDEPRLMYEQNILLRKDALGNFSQMLRDINTDPAMFRYLDSDSNVAGRPNENYAREVMELFTLGEGHEYTENDIKEAARAFTGYKIDPNTGRASLTEASHDNGNKHILGKRGVYNGDDVIELLLGNQERVAIYVTEKFWREFISDAPDHKEVYRIAAGFYHAQYDLKKLLHSILLTKAFWNPLNRGTLFKSPAVYLAGAVRVLSLHISDYNALVQMCDRLGQDLMDPPNVKGWAGAGAWISTESLLERWEITDNLLNGKMGKSSEMGAMMSGDTPATMVPKDDHAAAPVAKADDTNGSLLPMVAKPWLTQARSAGQAGIAEAAAVFLPLPPAEVLDTHLDKALHQLLHDPSFNLQ